MIDIHSHYIPKIDDGFSDLESSLTMLKNAVGQGITDIICTPHHREPFMLPYDKVKSAFEDFKVKVKEANIDVNLFLGREFFCSRDVLSSILKDNYSMPNSKYVLIEFSSFNSNDICEIVYELTLKGFIPIVAHIERYSKVTIEDAMDVKASGGLIQVNADSIVGCNRRFYKRTIKQLLSRELIDFVASDIHADRADEMQKAYQFVCKKNSKEYADKIFYENAKDVIKS